MRVLGQVQFRNENNVAGQLSALEKTFFTGDVRRQAIDRLRSDYRAIGRAADEVADYPKKQKFPQAIYEDFYKACNPAAAGCLGVALHYRGGLRKWPLVDTVSPTSALSTDETIRSRLWG